MKCKMKRKRRNYQSNGYADGYGYPAISYESDYGKERKMPEVKGSFWTACSKKKKWRHSFCDGI